MISFKEAKAKEKYLKPCPFCNSRAEIEEEINTDGTTKELFIQCTYCKISISTTRNFASIFKKWNTRVPTDNIIMKLEHLTDFCRKQIEEYIKDGNEEYIQNYTTELEAYKQSIKIIKDEIK